MPESRASLGSLFQQHALPEGFTLVRMHRNPVKVILSLSTMLAYIQALQSDSPKPAEILDYWTRRIERMLRKSDADDAMLRASDKVKVIDLDYEDLIRNPAAVAAGVLEDAGLQVTDDVRQRLSAYVDAHPRNLTGGGRFAYGLSVFNSTKWPDEAAIARHFEFYTQAKKGSSLS